MSFLRSSFSILIFSVLLTACFHDGPTIHTDDEPDNDSDGGTTQNAGLPTITVTSASDASLVFDESQNRVVFTATLSKAVNEDIELSYQATALRDISNSATRQDDFQIFSQDRDAASGSVIIPADSTQATFEVRINQDKVDEPDELFAVNIRLITPTDSSPKATVITTQLVVTIADDDPLPVITLNSESGTVITVKESVGVIRLQLKMPVSLSAHNIEIPVEFTAPATLAATAGEDFIDPGSIIFPGVTTESKDFSTLDFELLIRDDAIREDNETFFFSLKNPPTGLASLSEGTPALTITIEDDDANGGINDTQVVSCADDTSPASALCNNSNFPGQDGELNSSYDTRFLDINGGPPGSDADAVCVEDLNTGLIWEIKSNEVTSHRYRNWVFTWYNNLSNSNGGYDGITGGKNNCEATIDDCSTKTYIAELNKANGLCGNTNWRLPRVHELVSIMSFNPFPDPDNEVMVDQIDFPNAMPGYYWTANPVADFSLQAWAVYFGKTPSLRPNSEFVIPYDKVKSTYIRGVANRN